MPFKYFGRTTDFKGKTVWEIIGNLKNLGVGRIIARSMFERYPEPSYLKIIKVETLPNEENRKVKIWVEKTFRGKKAPKLVEMCSVTYKTDFKLIPKDEEASYCQRKGVEIKSVERILPNAIPFPPLLRELIINDLLLKGEVIKEEPKLYLKYRNGRENHAKVADDKNTPNVEVISGLGTPVSPNLYKGIV